MRWTWEDTVELMSGTVKGIIIGVVVGGIGACAGMIFIYLMNNKIFGLG